MSLTERLAELADLQKRVAKLEEQVKYLLLPRSDDAKELAEPVAP